MESLPISPHGEGRLNAKICFLGEAPSNIELKMQRPFVGPAGMLFNDLLKAAGIARGECLILNTFPTRVYKDKTERVIFDDDGNKLWIAGKGLTELGRATSQKTLRVLEKFTGNVICPLGGVALSFLYSDTRIQKWRGSILNSTGNLAKCIPTYHPSYILRGNPLAKYTVISDLRRLREESSTKKLNLPKRELIVGPTFPEVMAFLKDAKKAKRVATDIEVLNRQISCFSVALSPDLCMSIPLIHNGTGDRWTTENELQIWLAYEAIMKDKKITKINHNIIFDSTFLLQQNNIQTLGPLGCTMVAHHILYPDFPKGLDFVCSTYTREPYYKDDGKLWKTPWRNPIAFWIYNAKDAAVAFEIWNAIEPELEKSGCRWTYDFTINEFNPLQYMMIHGVKLNEKRLAEQREEAKAKLAQKLLDLEKAAIKPFNPASPKQCQDYFYVTKGIKPYISTKTGTVTADDKAMARIYKRYNLPEAKLVQEIRSLNKLISNYLEVAYDSDNRVRCSYNPRGTTTGRLSSSETIFATGLNFQNLDTDFKDFLEADTY